MPGRPRDAGNDAIAPSYKKPCYAHQVTLENNTETLTGCRAALGAIVKIKVQNFMTYTDAEIIPGPRLNLVLGPNGTGKSSLVNAICLGLAGSTQLLGRADNVRDFVRRGESHGYVAIWLSQGRPGQSICIKRILSAKDNSSEWRINGAAAQLKDVKERVKSLNIQLDNLCQFLPQDKVVEFAKLKPGQLLKETEKAIGNASLYHLHQELIKERNDLKSIESAAGTSKEELEVLEQTNEGLKRDVHRVEQKVELEKQVMHLEDKLVWTKFRDFKKHHQELEGEFELQTERLNNMRARDDVSDQPRIEKDLRLEAAHKVAHAADRKLRAAEEELTEAKEKLDQMVEDIDDRHSQLEKLDEDYDKWHAEIKRQEEDLQKIRGELAEVQGSQPTQTQNPEHSSEMKRLSKERQDITTTINALLRQADDRRSDFDNHSQHILDYHDKMKKLTSVKHQRLRALEQQYRGITELTRWLELPETKSLFKGRVYGPILCEVTVDSVQKATWLEQHCPRDLWARFVTEHQEDQDALGRESFQRYKFRPIITNFTGSVSEVIRHRFGDSSQYASEGIVSTLDEVFQAPQTIKLAMCNEANLHETYCGDRSLAAERFLEEHPNIMRLLTPESVYVVRKSQYNPAARSMNVGSITRRSTLLDVGGSRNLEEEKRTLHAMLDKANEEKDRAQEELRDLEKDTKQEERRAAAITAEINRITTAAQAARNRRGKLLTSEKTLAKTLAKVKARKDPRTLAPGIKADIDRLCEECCKLIAKLTDVNAQILRLHREHVSAEATNKELAQQVKTMEQEQRERKRALKKLEDLMIEMTEGIQREKKSLQKLKKEATERTGPMSEEIKARFARLPGSKSEIEDMIARSKDEIDGIELANPGALDEYNKRKREIGKLRKAFQEQSEDVHVRKAAIDDKMARWLPELRRIVGEINGKFGRSFQRIGCAGEVLLHEERDPDTQAEDFERFAIHIKVRFRAEEELQLLTAHRQSGGERSVSTILYLIAIQNVTVCPFRVVDEINQGMDPVNERKVFMQLAEAACQPDTPQCFLLTPKLLPDLPFSDQVTLLSIFNGLLVNQVARGFTMGRVLGGRRPVAAGSA